ncbi:MAG: glycerol kinase GlpK [Bacteroidales bacterium]|jgi:glycerol kinase|nr:glycerol kinase GlpK [Bacteroidales bacterium]MCK9499617.1 glycerol kinase GlpK [Bacteroidales bacterium]MDY0313736.1 glycerol kinase GlpK [Bacteroidales bacterium]NLB86881.1 glycerol kinase GlpK [Bacteroidales bacterium]
MCKKYILALDQGTTSSRAILFDENFNIAGIEQSETKQIYPKQSFVEQDPIEIRETQFYVARKLLAKLSVNNDDILGIGITNQRETTIVWDKNTGIPVYNAIVWQDKRTAEFCENLRNSEFGNYINNKTGLIVDAYFSASKIKWILDNIPNARQKAENGDLLFGTVDTWLVWNLSNKKLHITDYSNASRTMLFDIHNLVWDNKILEYFDIPVKILPKVLNSSQIYGKTASGIFGNANIDIAAIAGDQQAAMFGHNCFNLGDVKNTYGTGCFMLMNVGEKFVKSNSGLVTTIAWGIENKITYALEGSVFIAGAVIQWLRDKLKIIETAQETEEIALSLESSQGVYFVPAFAGLGAPYWDMNAKAAIHGITGGTTYKHIVRAAIESMALQTKDVIEAMKNDANAEINILNVDGGAAANNFLLQFQSDILNIEVLKPKILESTALGIAFMVAISTKFKTFDEILKIRKIEKSFTPKMKEKDREFIYSQWLKAVERVR